MIADVEKQLSDALKRIRRLNSIAMMLFVFSTILWISAVWMAWHLH